MAEVVRIDVQRSIEKFDFAGFDVEANYSDENVSKMMKLKDSDLQKKAEKEAEKLKGLSDDDLTPEQFDDMVETCLDLYSEIYAPVFGKDTFKDAYKHIQSITSTIQGFEDAVDYITDKIDAKNKQIQTKQQNKLNKYKNRKKRK